MGLFGGDSDSETNQTNTQKDNSALLEGEGLNVTDSGAGARDRGLALALDGNKSRINATSSALDQSGFSFSGARKVALEPTTAVILGIAIVASVYVYSKSR